MAQPANQKIYLAAIQQLPPLMKRVINNPALIDNAITLCATYQLTPKQQDMLMTIEREVIVQHVPVTTVPDEIKKIGLSGDEENQLINDFLGRIILPMEWHVGNVRPLIQSLGGQVEAYVAAASRQFPEVYAPETQQQENTAAASTATQEKPVSADEPVILRDIGDKLATPKGRAGVLLHLVALSQQIEDAGKSGKLTATQTTELLHSLDALSYAVNTQDLNPLEIAAIKRRLKTILKNVEV